MTPRPCGPVVSCGIRTPFGILSPCEGQVTHALLTRPPLEHIPSRPKPFRNVSPLDLHVLGTPPAFVLSQDQTLPFNPLSSHRVPGIGALAPRRPDSQDPLGIRCLFDCASCLIPCRISVSFSRFGAPRRSLSILSNFIPFVNPFLQEKSSFFGTFLESE